VAMHGPVEDDVVEQGGTPLRLPGWARRPRWLPFLSWWPSRGAAPASNGEAKPPVTRALSWKLPSVTSPSSVTALSRDSAFTATSASAEPLPGVNEDVSVRLRRHRHGADRLVDPPEPRR
jgi:hypothetical protein